MKILNITTALTLTAALFGFSGSAVAQDQSASQGQQFFFYGDLVRGRPRAGATGPTCVLTSQFKRGESVVWRMRVQDETGKDLTEEDLESLVVVLPDGEEIEMEYGPHPRNREDDWFWATSWEVPADYPTGTLGSKIVATDKEGNTAEWEPFNVESSKLTIIPGEVTHEAQ